MRIISYSQISTYNQCNFKWGLRYVKRLYSLEKSRPMMLGSLVHQALAQHHTYNKVDWEMLFLDSRDPLDKALTDDAQRIVSAYLSSGDAEFPGEVVGIEFPLQYSLDDNNTLVLWVDLVTKTDKGIYLWDHKTAGRMTRGLTHAEQCQLNLYGWALSRSGANVTQIGVNRITTAKTPKFERFTQEVSEGSLQKWGDVFMTNCGNLPNNDVDIESLSRSFSADCSWKCAFKNICRAHMMGHMEDVQSIIADRFIVTQHSDPKVYLERYETQIPQWWLE